MKGAEALERAGGRMQVYLVQHAEAKRKDQDPDRPLTDRGRREARRTAAFVAEGGVWGVRILHSGKTRARQTAEVFAAAVEADEVDQGEALAPLDDPRRTMEGLTPGEGDVMLVGHLPHLSRLAGLLLCGDDEAEPVRVRNAGVVALAPHEEGWALQWAVVPDLLPGSTG